MNPIQKLMCLLLAGSLLVLFAGCSSDDDGEPCGGQCMANATCNTATDQCECNAGYVMEGGACVEEDPCASVDCSDDPNSECDPATATCVCKDGYVDVNGTCTEDLCAGVDCSADPNSHCDDATGDCVCNDDYHDENGTCVADDPCAGVDCSADINSHCVDGDCVCRDGFVDDAGTCVADECCGAGTLNAGVCECDTGYNDADGDLLCGPDTPTTWPPTDFEAWWNGEWDFDTAACNNLPVCDWCGGYPGDIVSGLPAGTTFTRTLTTTASDCHESLYDIDKRTEPGNVEDETGQSFGIMHGNCATDLDGLHGGTFFDDIAASCSVNQPLVGIDVISVELGTLEYTANGGTGKAVIHVIGVQALLGVPDCTIEMDVVYTPE